MVTVVKDDKGVEKGEYFDVKSGMKFTVQLHGDPFVTQTKTTVKSTAQVQSVSVLKRFNEVKNAMYRWSSSRTPSLSASTASRTLEQAVSCR